MIKGRYVALVEINFHIDEQEGLRPFDEIKGDVMNGDMTEMLEDLIESEFDKSVADIKVTQQFADVYKVDEEQE